MSGLSGGEGVPGLLRWDIVSKCNLACTHCCVGDLLRNENAHDLSTQQLMAGLSNAARAGVRQIHFLGGEPTIRRDFISLLRHARQVGLEVSFNTNGIRQDQKYLDALRDVQPTSITISVDGPDAESHDAVRGRGTFAKTVLFIRKLVSANLLSPSGKDTEIQIQSVLTAHWVSRAGEILRLADGLRVGTVIINHLAAIGDAVKNSDSLRISALQHFDASFAILSSMRKYPKLRVKAPIRLKVIQLYRELSDDRSAPLEANSCPAIDENSQVNHDGSVTPCQLAQSFGLDSDAEETSISERDFEQILQAMSFDIFKTKVNGALETTYAKQIPCNRCHFLGRGCRPCPLPDDPKTYKTNYQCLIAEAILEAGHRRGSVKSLEASEIDKIALRTVQENPLRFRALEDPIF
jgi:MoaA/NifB/PqqE/SkfB family radical SAM enzyme